MKPSRKKSYGVLSLPAAERPPCRGCGAVLVSRPRGLCWKCYYTPAVRAAFPPTSKYAGRGHGTLNKESRPAPNRCGALPGSEEKIVELERRASLGLALFRDDEPFIRPSGEWAVPLATVLGVPSLIRAAIESEGA